MRSARLCPDPGQRKTMTDFVRIKFRELRGATDRTFVARALREGEEELDQMNYYHEMHRSRQASKIKEHAPSMEEADSVSKDPPQAMETNTAMVAPHMLDETPFVVLLEDCSGAREMLGEILISAGTTVTEARAIIEDELTDVLPSSEGHFEVLSAQGIRILARQEAKRRVVAHCSVMSEAVVASKDPLPSLVVRWAQQLPGKGRSSSSE
jgi:hypothetical protein